MLWPPQKLNEAYDNIKDTAVGAGCSVLIFVASDCDALCACQILTNLLRTDNISYKIKPVLGYDDIKADYRNLLAENDEIKSVVMLNCGGTINLQALYPLNEDALYYVIDSHRPYNHVNISPTTSSVIIFGDEIINENDAEAPDGNLSDFVSDDEEDEDDDSSDEADEYNKGNDEEKEFEFEQDDDDESTSRSKRRKLNEDDENINTMNQQKSEKQLQKEIKQQNKLKLKEYKNEQIMKFRQYYRGTYYGQPAAHSLYLLTLQLNKQVNHLLWLSIVGTTHHYIKEQLSQHQYQQLFMKYHEQVSELNPDDTRFNAADDGTKIPLADEGRIEVIEELKIMLYRHWPLYDAFYYSDFVAVRLGTWRSDGRQQMETFFAKMGISLKESKQKYNFMSVKLRKNLLEKINTHAEKFKLNDMTYGSFQCRFGGFQNQYSAADIALAVTALLEFPPKNNDLMNSVIRSINGNDTMEEDNDEKDLQAEYYLQWQDQFNSALDALGSRNKVELIDRGIKCSMELQKAVVAEGVAVIEQKLIQSAGYFRFLILERLADAHEKIFSRPQGLSKLSLFLLQAYRANGRWTGDAIKPFVIAVKNSKTDTALVVGVNFAEDSKTVLRNDFGKQFRDAADQIEARYKHDSFNSECIEIQMDQVQLFLIALSTTMADEHDDEEDEEDEVEANDDDKDNGDADEDQTTQGKEDASDDEDDDDDDDDMHVDDSQSTTNPNSANEDSVE